MHKKRQAIKKFWPVPRKGTKYLAVATHEASASIPLVIVVRDILKIVKTQKELKKLTNNKQIMINKKIVKNTKYPVLLFDSVSFPTIKKNYRAVLKNKKFGLEEIPEKESMERIYKIVDKKKLDGGKMQINLNGGRNVISSEKMNVGDFVLLNVLENKIIKTITLQKETTVAVTNGKHIGVYGKIKDIRTEGQNKIAEIISDKGEKIKVNVKNLFVVWEK